MSVYANSRLILHAGDGQQHVCAPPDVCKTPSPGGPVPVPYVNIAMDSDLAKGAKKTKIEGNPVAIASSELSTSTGDEPGTAGGGVVSSKTKGKLTWASTSPDVKVEGKGVARFLDPAQHNGNTSNSAFISAGTTGLAYGDDSPCTICNKSTDSHTILETKKTQGKAKGMLEALGDKLKAQRKDIQEAKDLTLRIKTINASYQSQIDVLKDDRAQLQNESARISKDIARNPAENGPKYGPDLQKVKKELASIKKKITNLGKRRDRETQGLKDERQAINDRRLKGKNVLVMDDGDGTYSWGYMVGILLCQCGKEYVACSGEATPGFKSAVSDAGAILCPMHDTSAASNGGGKMSSDHQAKYDELVAATVKGADKWECAAPKCIQKCQGDGHKPVALTEMYYSPIGSHSVSVTYTETTYKHTHHKRAQRRGGMVSEKVTKEFSSGESVPSCSKCQVLLPGMMCDTKDALCP